MEVRVLGSLEVSRDGRRLDIGRGKQRTLLAILLLSAGKVVSTDRLIEALWGGRPPASALNSVRIYVSQLRKALGDGCLQTQGRGYLLAVDAAQVDASRFERMLAEGRELRISGDAAGAVELLQSALDLWRGPPLADFSYESFAQTEIARLEELHLVALEERIDAHLELGRHAELVPELEALVHDHPLRERLRGQLMLALYRSGRQPEALEVYQEGRRLLASELGLEPGPALKELERGILQQAPALEAPAARPTAIALARRTPLVIAAAAALLLLAIGAVVFAETRGGGSAGIASVSPNAVGVLDAKTKRIVAQIPIGGGPARLAAGSGGTVWIGSDDSGTVSSLTPGTYDSTKLVAIAGFPSDLAVGEGSVWVVDGRSGQLDKVDPVYGAVAARVQVTVRNPVYDVSRFALDPISVAAGGGSVWVTDGTEMLVRVDPRATRVVDRIDLGDPLDGVAVGGGAVWAISGPSATAIRLDREGTETLRIPIVSGPEFESPYPLQVRVGEGYVWVLNGNTATVTKIDPGQRVVSANVPIGIGRGPARLAVGEGAAWVASADGTLARIDATTNDVAIIPVGHNLRDVAVGAGAVWVTGGSGLSSTAEPSDVVSDPRVQPLPPSTCSPIYYEGPGSPEYLIASDLPLQGYGTTTPQQSQAIQFILRKHQFQAGSHTIGYQSCDDSTISQRYDASARCASNARSYAANPSVIGVIGPFNSGCAIQEIPTLNRAPGGPVATISYSNTVLGLTQAGRGTNIGEPDVYYPTNVRNYARIIATDDLQAAADAVLARRLGARRIFVVNEQYDYGRVLSENFEAAAAKLGLKIVGRAIFFYGGSSYADVIASMTRADPDAVFFAAPILADSAELLSEIHSALPGVKIMATDGFASFEQLRKLAGAAAEGMTVSLAGVPTAALRGPGKSFVAEFGEQVGQDPDEWSVGAAQATEMLLEAIARSDGTRASVTAELGKSKVTNGILGSFSIDRKGDTTAGAITIYRIVHGAPQVLTVIRPSPKLVR